MKDFFFLKKILKNIFSYAILDLVKKAKKSAENFFGEANVTKILGKKKKHIIKKAK